MKQKPWAFLIPFALSAVYLAVWRLLPPLLRTEPAYAVPYAAVAQPLFWFCAGALALWVLGRAFPLHRWPLPRPVRRLLAVLDGLCAAFYLLSLCLPPLHLLWVFVPWVYALPGALTLYLLPAR
ncbi:MAG TPA: hypothetical protein H9707_09190 [Candidatus Butyricicoccus avicola]|nr:hypothetical protein [Candidatus Butyricicoccus avicola]